MTLKHVKSEVVFDFYKETIGIKNGNGINIFIPHELPQDVDPKSVLQLISDDEKVYFDNRASYFHVLLHWLRYALAHIKRTDKKITFIFALSPGSRDQRVQAFSTLTEYLVDKFQKMGHSVVFLDNKYAFVNNFVSYKELHDFDPESATEIGKFLSEGLDLTDTPNEKIYLSRGKTTTFNGNVYLNDISLIDPDNVEKIKFFRESNQYKFSNRVDNEKLLEDYFKGLGFKIVYPEDFDSYKEQLVAIASAKVLASLTSASLATSIVMRPGTVIVELATPLEEGPDTYRTHVHYKQLSDVNRKTYISIPHERIAEEIIGNIEANKPLKTFLAS